MNADNFFKPKSIAVIGASADKNKVGYSLVLNLLGENPISRGLNEARRKVYPVSIKEKDILGVKAYASVLDIPENIDLAVIALRADIVPQVLADCGKKKIPNVVVISSGFKETGPAGKELEDKLAEVAKENEIALLGPNCLGIIDTKNNLNASFSPQKPLFGNIALLSQSGALGTAFLDWAIGEGVGFSKFISLGNEAQLTEIDFLEFLKDDKDTHSILIYLEKVSDGRKFIDLVSEITKTKQVVILKAGVSNRGMKAVMSHTGSLAPESSVFAGAIKQSGAITVSSLREFFNVAKLLSMGVTINEPVQNLVILTNGGGPSVIATDLVSGSVSLSLAEFNESTKSALKKVLPPMAAVGNPIDIIGDALADRYDKALEILCDIGEVDGIMVMLTPQMMTEAEATARLLVKYKQTKKLFPVFIGGPSIQKGRAALIKSGLVHFTFPKDVVEALDDLANGAPKTLSKTAFEMPQPQKTVLDSVSQMSFAKMSKLLNEYNISLSGKFVKDKKDLGGALKECGKGPYAMKAISPSVVHKTDAGAVKLNIANLKEATSAWEEMEESILSKNKKAKIEGVLVQQMVGDPAFAKASAGKEVIIGMKRDATFGPTILFGLGGILAEAIKDTALRVAPITKIEALKMMQEIKGIKILEGMRGEKPVNFDTLADIIVNLSRLSLEHSEIKEIDLNPVMVTEKSATIVDARFMV